MQLTKHFSLEELIASETATRKGIDNTPDETVKRNLQILAEGLERIREFLQKPIRINSGYRCKKLNQAVGGSKTSEHILGLAADIICPAFGSPIEVCRAIAAINVGSNQIIHEFGQWCHVSFPAASATAKNELLTIANAKTGYVAGLVSV